MLQYHANPVEPTSFKQDAYLLRSETPRVSGLGFRGLGLKV